jgi:hypothetical protein
MSNRMNHDYLFLMDQFIDNPVVADSQLEQSFKLSCQCFELKFLEVPCQPMHSLDDPPSHRFVQPGQFFRGGIQEMNPIHASVEPQSLRQDRQGLAPLPGRYGLSLARQPIFERLSQDMPLIGIAEQLQQLPLNRRFDDFLQLELGHLCDRRRHT